MLRRALVHSWLIPTIALFSTSALAASVAAPDREPLGIFGGAPSESCGWPTTVFVDGCTGTLVHPEVVVFAAHCMFFAGGQSPPAVGFGEDTSSLTRTVATGSCSMFPGWTPDDPNLGADVAFCVLAEPVNDVPIVPILMGCETEVLTPGQEITLVGFGNTDQGSFGIKHEVVTTINGPENSTEVNVGGNGTSSCNGDSGGPAYVQLEDGSWRVFGITSRGTSPDCAQPSIYGLIPAHTEWIEEASGIDITPCHDANGQWNPTEACTEFPLSPGFGESSWEEGCAMSRLSGPAATCGDAFGEEPGTTGGETDASTGSPGETTDGPGSSTGEAGDTGDAGGTADASSGDGTTSPSTSTSTSTGDPAQTDTEATATDGAAEDTDKSGCGCTATPGAPTWMSVMFGLLLFRRRRSVG